MPCVVFETNLEEDVKNTTETVNFSIGGKNFGAGVEKEIVDIVKNSTKEEATAIVTRKMSEYYEKNKEIIRLKIKEFEKEWNPTNDRFFERLEKITGKSVCSQKFTACITTAGRCPYNPKKFWFMVSLFNPPEQVKTTIAHEILHMQVINNYEKMLPAIPSKLAWDVIEVLTFLLDEEFSDLLSKPDKGYPAHQELRNELLKEWRKDKDFEKFLPKAIEITRNLSNDI